MTTPDGLARLQAAAPGVTSVPVITIGDAVFVGFDRGRVARALGVEGGGPAPQRPQARGRGSATSVAPSGAGEQSGPPPAAI